MKSRQLGRTGRNAAIDRNLRHVVETQGGLIPPAGLHGQLKLALCVLGTHLERRDGRNESRVRMTNQQTNDFIGKAGMVGGQPQERAGIQEEHLVFGIRPIVGLQRSDGVLMELDLRELGIHR